MDREFDTVPEDGDFSAGRCYSEDRFYKGSRIYRRGVYVKKCLFSLSMILVFVLLLNACGAASTTVPTDAVAPSPVPSPTRVPLLLTPLESALAPGPTAAPLDEIVETHSITFDTPDGATITGELYGSGETAVIFSVMGNCRPGWRELAHLTAAQGFMALTYPWRGCGESGRVDDDELQKFVDDARGAINFAREQGADKIILAGASLGGLASAKLAIESGASALIIVASPPAISQWGFEIEAADLDTSIPKLFITAEKDAIVSASATRDLYELAAEPKEWQVYPGNRHGTDLFETESGGEMQQRILEFILTAAS